jgi:GNAT superfamily N-acetyltransferase
VTLLVEEDRPTLCRALDHWPDFPRGLSRSYARWDGWSSTFVAWAIGGDRSGGLQVVGMLNGSFNADLSGNREFASFDLPQAPHPMLNRVHVDKSARRRAVGRRLVEAYVAEAVAHGCRFVGGFLDRTSDATSRWGFFEHIGFEVDRSGTFGTYPQ